MMKVQSFYNKPINERDPASKKIKNPDPPATKPKPPPPPPKPRSRAPTPEPSIESPTTPIPPPPELSPSHSPSQSPSPSPSRKSPMSFSPSNPPQRSDSIDTMDDMSSDMYYQWQINNSTNSNNVPTSGTNGGIVINQNLQTLAQASPLTITYLMQYGVTASIAEQEYQYIQSHPFLSQYYLTLNRTLSSTILALQSISSQCIHDNRTTDVEDFLSLVHSVTSSSNIVCLPLVTSLAMKIASFTSDYQRNQSLENVSRTFPNVTYHSLIEILSREMTLSQENKIKDLIQQTKESNKGSSSGIVNGIKSILDKLTSGVEWIQEQYDFVSKGVPPSTVVEALASLHANNILEGIMYYDYHFLASTSKKDQEKAMTGMKNFHDHLVFRVFRWKTKGMKSASQGIDGEEDSVTIPSTEGELDEYNIHPISSDKLWILKCFALEENILEHSQDSGDLHSPMTIPSMPSPGTVGRSNNVDDTHIAEDSQPNGTPPAKPARRRPLPPPPNGSTQEEPISAEKIQELISKVTAIQAQVNTMEDEVEKGRKSEELAAAGLPVPIPEPGSDRNVEEELDDLRLQLSRLTCEVERVNQQQKNNNRQHDSDVDVDMDVDVGGGSSMQQQKKASAAAAASSTSRSTGRQQEGDAAYRQQMAQLESTLVEVMKQVRILQEDLVSVAQYSAANSAPGSPSIANAPLPLSYASTSVTPTGSERNTKSEVLSSQKNSEDHVVQDHPGCCGVM